MKNFLILFTFLLIPYLLFSQSNSELTIYYVPNSVVIRIDKNQVIDLTDKPNPYIISLPAGDHTVEAWSKEFEIHEFETTITADETNKLVVSMKKLSQEFKDFRKVEEEYAQRRGKNTMLLSLTALSAGGAAVFLKQRSNLINELEEAKKNYAGAVNEFEISSAHAKHEEVIKKVDKQIPVFNIAGAAFAASTAALSYLWLKNRKTFKSISVPVFEKENPFVFHSNSSTEKLTHIEFTGHGFMITF